MIKKIIVSLMLGIATSVVVASPSYVGTSGCSNCHKDEFSDWQKSKHASAFELLQPGKRVGAKKKANLDPDKDYTTDEKCLKCHTTGYKKEGGFVSISATPEMKGIGCEMCHGPGSEFRNIHKEKRLEFTRAEVQAAGQIYGSLDPGVCKKCHGHPDTPFKSSVDPKYTDDVQALLKNNVRAFHTFYELDGKH